MIQLAIDESSGAAKIVNTAVATSWQLDGYVIQSAVPGGLLPDPANVPDSGWDSLTDAGLSGWREVAPTSEALSEVNLGGSLTLAPGEELNLGLPLDAGVATLADLTFDFNLPDLGSLSGQVVPFAGSFLAADFNKDGNVDGDDFLAWQSGFGALAGATQEEGDADDDGDVDGDDFLTWQQQFGGNSGGTGSTVPEPATSCICLATLIWLTARRAHRVR